MSKMKNEIEILVAPPPSLLRQQSSDVIWRIRHLELYRAEFKGKWETAKDMYAKFPDDISARITKRNDTALHIAAIGQHTFFAKELVLRMTSEELALKNEIGYTAFCLAAAVIRDNDDMLQVSSLSGHKYLTGYLYQLTRHQFNDRERVQLLLDLIRTDLYDTALDLVQRHPETAISRGRDKETALHVLAGKHLASLDLANQNQRGILKSCFNKFSGIKKGRSKLYSQALQLVKCIWKEVMLLCDDSQISDLTRSPRQLIFAAAEIGNAEFLSILINDYPSLIWQRNHRGHSIFHIAVLHRQNDIFKLVSELGSVKDLIIASKDCDRNNILHLAGRLGPRDKLDAPGAALQMQRELLWFKAVEIVTRPGDVKAINYDAYTPWDLFVREHAELKSIGEEWMKNTSNSLMVVATLIAAMVFTAALTIPGGNVGDTGVPIFNQQLSFKIFSISVAVSLVSSLTSILTFISIHTSSYKIDNFLWQLPLKLMSGLLFLFVSVASMMVLFCTTFFMVFREGLQGFTFSLNIIASVVVLMFIRQQYALFIDALRLTFNPLSYFYQKPSFLQ
ncbi:hypothetical protein ACOSQ4_013441 [Xanthoceras sorbifolium]